MEVAFLALTPMDIHNKQFAKGFRGYDEDEVNEFLDQVIKDYETVIREKEELFSKVNELEERLNHFSNIEETLSKSILVAQESAEELKRSSKKKSRSLSLKSLRKTLIALLTMLFRNRVRLR